MKHRCLANPSLRQYWRGACLTLALVATPMLQGCTVTIHNPTHDDLKQEVIAAERAFAKTMADRDLTAFGALLATDAVFFSGDAVLRGKSAVIEGWKGLYAKPQAPFSWVPKDVEVLASGDLALSSGPVTNSAGKLVATYTSIWRREAPGVWRVVFDTGTDVCDCAKP